MTATSNADTNTSTAGAAGAASTISRDDIQNLFESMKNSLDSRVSAIENTLNSLNTRFSQVEAVADVGTPEAQARGIVTDSHKWGANEKRSYDEYQDLALAAARRSQDRYDALMSDARHNINAIQKLVIDRLANANNNDEMATDRKWNVNETDALAAALDAAIARAIGKDVK